MFRNLRVASAVVLALMSGVAQDAAATLDGSTEDTEIEGVEVEKPGLTPNYPAGRCCSPLTSLYRSWIDVDGSRRDELHSGVDGGRLRDPILAPAPGVVVAAWQADWGWGREGALLIQHSRADLGLADGPAYYYSEFDHLRYAEIRSIAVGKRVKRGEQLATVFRPGGKRRYLPEVHWEVWTIDDDAVTTWSDNEYGRPSWRNETAELIDPVQMMSLNAPPSTDGSVDVPVFDPRRDYGEFRGFTYILPCPETSSGRSSSQVRRRR
jgi:murein DD-endopeptidase MepM/ murein hydrolase activator NlpD